LWVAVDPVWTESADSHDELLYPFASLVLYVSPNSDLAGADAVALFVE